MPTYWISFTKPDIGNVGVCIVDAANEDKAIKKTHVLGINPGGQAALLVMPSEASEEVGRWGKDHLILPEDLKKAGYSKLGDLDNDTRVAIEEQTTKVCVHHNEALKPKAK